MGRRIDGLTWMAPETKAEARRKLLWHEQDGRIFLETRQDVAPIVSYLASDDARWLTGEIILASGGMR